MTKINLTPASHSLFMALWNDRGNWNGTPLFGGNVGGDKASRGNLTDLKKKGLLTTTQDEENKACQWVSFTEQGEAYAAAQAEPTREQDEAELANMDVTEEMMAEAEAQEQEIEEQAQAEGDLADPALAEAVEEILADDAAPEIIGFSTRKEAVAASKLDPKATGDVTKNPDGTWTYATAESSLEDDAKALVATIKAKFEELATADKGACALIREVAAVFPDADKSAFIAAGIESGLNRVTCSIQRLKQLRAMGRA